MSRLRIDWGGDWTTTHVYVDDVEVEGVVDAEVSCAVGGRTTVKLTVETLTRGSTDIEVDELIYQGKS